jgi:hypothetical protein
MPASHVIPLPLAGNTTEQQNRMLQEFLTEAAATAFSTAIEQLDRQGAQTLIETGRQLKSELTGRMVDILHRHTVSNKYRDEEVGSDRIYPPAYYARPVEAQVTELRRCFPTLGACNERLSRKPLLEGAEDWIAIPRWQALASSYNEAVEMILDVLAAKRRFSNRLIGKLSEKYLRQSERTRLAESILAEQQPGCDILVVPAQAGLLHRGCSARRTRALLEPNEFALGAFAFAAMLLTHPERLSVRDTLMVDCGGDEYSAHGDYTFDRVPLFDYDLGGIEFSMFYEDRARNLWGTPTGFLYKFS